MSRGWRLGVFLVGAGCIGVLLLLAVLDLPSFGTARHPYRDRAVAAAVAHRTANVVSAVNFDQRALDTLGEETIFFGSVVGAMALLRAARDEEHGGEPDGEPDGEPERGDGAGEDGSRSLEAVRLVGYLWLPLTLVVGVDVVAHGHLTPGGGFQGGVVLATGLHLLYVSGSYPALARLRNVRAYDYVEATGAAAFTGLGVAGTVLTGDFLGNVMPWGRFGQLLSAGTVPILNAVVGLEVGAGVMVLLAQFLEQALSLRGGGGERPGEGAA